jgi:osmotically inducible protein OsmC
MALSAGLGRAGFTPDRVSTRAAVSLEKGDAGFRISRIDLTTEASVPGLDEAGFQEQAQTAKANCPVSQALAGVEITLEAKLV